MDRETKNRKARISRALGGALKNSFPVHRVLEELFVSDPKIKSVRLVVDVELLMEKEVVSKKSSSANL